MKKHTIETIVGVFVVIALIWAGFTVIKLARAAVLGEDSYPVYARFATVAGLRAGCSVNIYGMEVGHVRSLSLDADRQMVLVGLDVRKDVKIYDDASAAVKSAGLIGDKYIKIEPGGAGQVLKPGGTITETSVPADIEDLIGKFAFGDVKKDSRNTAGQTAR
jgi:phospholipid/cholesterol/gamma-HCH transport system substrate-binding protein